jgi:CubicO group peptidase (beta-lactamase class C family)
MMVWMQKLRAVLVAATALVVATTGCDGQASNSASGETSAASTAAAPASAGDLARAGAEIAEGVEALVDPTEYPVFRPIRAVIIEVDGHTVFEHYYRGSASDTSNVFSATKSFVGTLIGIALADGSLRSVDQTLSELLPAYAADMEPEEAAITLRQLLTMTAGLPDTINVSGPFPWELSDDWVKGILADQLEQPPGEGFAYSDASSHLLSAILTEAVGTSVLDYARAELFDPLGIAASGPAADLLAVPKNLPAYERAGFSWPHDPQGVQMGWAHLKLTARDMAALGQLYLDDGRWQGEQVVPTAWVHDAITEQVQANLTNGYGYQWWVTTAGGHDAYAAIGYGGQLIEVVPDLRLVAVFSTDVPETGATVDARSYTSIVSAKIRQVESE